MVTENSNYWGWAVLLGIILVIIGVVAVVTPYVATLATILTLGWILIIGGVVQLIFVWPVKNSSGFIMHLVLGLFNVLIGFLFVMYPAVSAMTITILLAALFLGLGLFRIFTAVTVRFEYWGWFFVSGLIALLLGILILQQWPSSATWVIGLFIGIDFIFAGWSFIATGYLMNRLKA